MENLQQILELPSTYITPPATPPAPKGIPEDIWRSILLMSIDSKNGYRSDAINEFAKIFGYKKEILYDQYRYYYAIDWLNENFR